MNNDNENNNNKTYAYIAIGLIIVGAIAFGVSFTKMGIYALSASMICEIAAITFVNLQEKKNKLNWLIYLKVAAYAVFIAALLVFVGGTIWSSDKK